MSIHSKSRRDAKLRKAAKPAKPVPPHKLGEPHAQLRTSAHQEAADQGLGFDEFQPRLIEEMNASSAAR
jgi:hypothetical protein